MPDVGFGNLLIVVLIAAAAPLLSGLVPRTPIPTSVVEILAGVVAGPSVLGWVEVDLPVSILALIGLAFLLFLSGLEIDLDRLRGRLGRLALTGWLFSLALGVGVGWGLGALGWTRSPLLIAVALSATSLGVVIPLLKDAGQAAGPLGQLVLATASLANFGGIVVLSLFFGMRHGSSTGTRLALVAGLAVAAVALVVTVGRVGHGRWLGATLVRLQDTTAEIRIRLAVLLLLGFVTLAARLGVATILGAFLAGLVLTRLDRDAMNHPQFRVKLDAIGFGFVVPIFFVTTGLRFDLGALMHSPSGILRVPVLLAALLLVRGVPALLAARLLPHRSLVAVGLLQATSLPFIVTVTQIGLLLGAISPVTSSALVSAGLLSVVLFPPVALALIGADARSGAVAGPRAMRQPAVGTRSGGDDGNG